uniref:ARAD1C03146p n=1 Tax=Blastobotrys adeninivorans TaxID=409370 RepID=A0A060T554_BLAAD
MGPKSRSKAAQTLPKTTTGKRGRPRKNPLPTGPVQEEDEGFVFTRNVVVAEKPGRPAAAKGAKLTKATKISSKSQKQSESKDHDDGNAQLPSAMTSPKRKKAPTRTFSLNDTETPPKRIKSTHTTKTTATKESKQSKATTAATTNKIKKTNNDDNDRPNITKQTTNDTNGHHHHNGAGTMRRSSLGNRGKRLSSIGNGFVADPHGDVDPRYFYKHLDAEAPEPHRMKQVLLWCGRRAMDDTNEMLRKMRERARKQTEDEITALNIAKVIQEEIIRDLVEGKITTSWWNKPDDYSERVSEQRLKPNIRNITNAENLKAFETKLQDLEKEQATWLAQLDRIKASVQREHDALVQARDNTDKNKLDHDEINQGESVDKVVKSLPPLSTIRYKVDDLYATTSLMGSLSKTCNLVCDNHNRTVAESLPTPSQSLRDVLRAFSRHNSAIRN